MAIQRVLQVLQDTDATDQHLAALELHKGLAQAGCEVRTLALGPGKIGQLATSVPVISPSRRSVAAYTQLRTEQRWADALILQGAHVADVAALVPIPVPTAISLWAEPAQWKDGKRPSWRLMRSARRGSQLIVNNSAAQATLEQVLDARPAFSESARQRSSSQADGTDRSHRTHLIHTGVGAVERAASGLGSGSITDAQLAARRRAAKQALGLDESALAIRVLAPVSERKGATQTLQVADVEQAAASVGMSFIGTSARASTSAQATDELLLAASDVVVVVSCEGGPSVELLRSMQAGAIAVTESSAAMAELIEDHVTGLSFGPGMRTGAPAADSLLASLTAALSEIMSDLSLCPSLARAGAERVEAEYALGRVQSSWLEVLHAALA